MFFSNGRDNARINFILLVVTLGFGTAICVKGLPLDWGNFVLCVSVVAGAAWIMFEWSFPETKLDKIKRLHQRLEELKDPAIPDIKDAVDREIEKEARPIRKKLENILEE